MAYLMVKHTVSDFDAWKAVFDEHERTRRDAGSHGGRVLRRVDDGNQVVVLLDWDSVAEARRFAESDDLRRVMERAGVQGAPEILYLDDAGQSDA